MTKTIKPLEASLFVTIPEDVQSALLRSGVLPINDVFYPLWGNTNKINLLYGSYGSGKSVFIVDILIYKCMNDEYFRCYYGRKILDTVRGTVFKTITDRIKELNLSSIFNFSDKPNGTMIISCKENGNEFIPFGANDAQSLKSIKDPSHFFCEEFDQFSFEDFGFIYSRLRTKKAITQFYGAFNTEKIYQSHWIRKVLFDGEYKDQVFTLKANYFHNHFIDHEDYLNKLKLIANGNTTTLNAIAYGEWGVVRTGDEFWNCFEETRHVKPVQYDKSTTIHVSVDENVNPYVTQTIWQILTEQKIVRQIHEILSKAPKNNAPKAAGELADWLDSIEYANTIFVYGDPSGGKRSTIDENNASFFDKFISVLKQRGYHVVNRVGRSAPEVSLSGDFVNAIYENNYEGWSIEIGDLNFGSIEDYIMVKRDADGKMLKEKVKDKQTGITYEPRGHASDTKRYIMVQALPGVFEKFKGRRKRRGGVDV